MNITWDAADYTENFQFVHQYGEDVLELLSVKPQSLIIDLGCGNGALTHKIADKGARVIGIDASADMLAVSRREYPDLTFWQADATTFHLDEKADAIFSNAVFHWIDDQEALLENLAANLKKGGQLVCEFGGKGCTETIHAALEAVFAEKGYRYPRTFYFPTIGEYAPLMEKHGLRVVYATLFDRPTPLKGDHGVEDWIRMFVKKPFENMNTVQADAIIREAEDRTRMCLYDEHTRQWFADYVRIRIKAIRI